MSNTLSHSYLELLYPDLSLARAFDLPTQGPIHEALRMLLDYFQFSDGHNSTINKPAAYQQSYAHIEGCLILFNRYVTEYPLDKNQRDIALAAWLCQRYVDPTDPDYWQAVNADVLSILALLEENDARPLKLSHGDNDPALALNTGLKLWIDLTSCNDYYRMSWLRQGPLRRDPAADRQHAFEILTDRPALETQLTADCRAQAKAVIDALRGPTPELRLKRG
jgi:hypothetical protein